MRLLTSSLLLSTIAFCQGPPPPGPPLQSLRSVPVPQPSNLNKYVRDQNALVVLGKALYWDMQVGSDGRTACATCHFHAGADHRLQNQLADPISPFSANTILTSDEFPFHLLADINNNRAPIIRNSTARAGSAGVYRRTLTNASPGNTSDDGTDLADNPLFSIGGVNVRQVTARNTPSVINAVFNFRNFWDGRASNIFTGMTPFGESDKRANALVFSNGKLEPEYVHIDNSSLASQAVGPVVSTVEMSYEGRTWPQVGRRILSLRPLTLQKISQDDGVLGPFADPSGRGFDPAYSYLSLVQAAFQPAYWNSSQSGEFTQAEFNFALFFGLAVQAYEATLVAAATPYDRFLEGDRTALSTEEQAGLQLFRGRAGCAGCHGGAETTAIGFTFINRVGLLAPGGPNPGTDNGFFRTGVSPSAEDIGLAGIDDFGNPFAIGPSAAVNGEFKSPALRNVEFTGPYFHNGGQATLDQVIDFYSRGGDFPERRPGGGIPPINLSTTERANLVALMKGMSDDKVRFERAPFDHPELCVPVGAVESAPGVLTAQTDDARFLLSAVEKWAAVPEVGKSGNSAPLQTFDELLRGIGNDGSRAHTMTETCSTP